MLGTYLLVFIGPGAIVVASLLLPPSSTVALIFVAAVFGTTVGSVILLLGRRSGAHINPAITVASLFAGAIKRELFIPYILFQVAGGLFAGLSLLLVFRSFQSPASLGSTKLATSINPLEGVALEAAGTFLLATAALSASYFVKSPPRQALLVGGTLFVLIMLIGPLTGASFNPVRSLGPSVFSDYFGGQLIYLVGPILGACTAGLAFSLVKKSYGRKSKKLDLVCVC
jgi:glycerol uptake facilitator-like aquaporin